MNRFNFFHTSPDSPYRPGIISPHINSKFGHHNLYSGSNLGYLGAPPLPSNSYASLSASRSLLGGSGPGPVIRGIPNPISLGLDASDSNKASTHRADIVPAALSNANGANSQSRRFSTLVITLDNNSCGKVIGPAGEPIRSLRQAVGCQVTTDKKGERSDGNREIRVEGALISVLQAANVIHGLVGV